MLSPLLALATIISTAVSSAKCATKFCGKPCGKSCAMPPKCENRVFYPDKAFYEYECVSTFYCGNLLQLINMKNPYDCYRYGYVPHRKRGILVATQKLNLGCTDSQTVQNECKIECQKKKRCPDDDEECNCSDGCCYDCTICKLPRCSCGSPLLLTFDSCLISDTCPPVCPEAVGLPIPNNAPFFGIFWYNAFMLNIPLSISTITVPADMSVFLNALVSKNMVVSNFDFIGGVIGDPFEYIHLFGERKITLVSLYFSTFPCAAIDPGCNTQILMTFTPLNSNGTCCGNPCCVAMPVEDCRKPTLVIFGSEFKNIWGVNITGSLSINGSSCRIRFTLDNISLCSEWVPPAGITP